MTPITGDDVSCAKRTHVWEWLCVHNRCSIRHSVLNPSGNIKGVWRIFTCQSDSKPNRQRDIVWCNICNSTVIDLPGDADNDINELNPSLQSALPILTMTWERRHHGCCYHMIDIKTWRHIICNFFLTDLGSCPCSCASVKLRATTTYSSCLAAFVSEAC